MLQGQMDYAMMYLDRVSQAPQPHKGVDHEQLPFPSFVRRANQN